MHSFNSQLLSTCFTCSIFSVISVFVIFKSFCLYNNSKCKTCNPKLRITCACSKYVCDMQLYINVPFWVVPPLKFSSSYSLVKRIHIMWEILLQSHLNICSVVIVEVEEKPGLLNWHAGLQEGWCGMHDWLIYQLCWLVGHGQRGQYNAYHMGTNFRG